MTLAIRGLRPASNPERIGVDSDDHLLDKNLDGFPVWLSEAFFAPCSERFRIYAGPQNGGALNDPLTFLSFTDREPLTVFWRIVHIILQDRAEALVCFRGEPRYVPPMVGLRSAADPSCNDLDRPRFIFV